MKCHKPPKVIPMVPMVPMVPMIPMTPMVPMMHGRLASATVQPRGAKVLRQQVSRTHGASRPGDTIRNGNDGGAWRNRHNGRNVGADVILTGGGLLPAPAHCFPALRL